MRLPHPLGNAVEDQETENMHFTYTVFDLDDTLYPQEAGLMQAIGQRISAWLQQNLHLSAEEALALRHFYVQRYGTTLGGLIAERDVDADGYLSFVHDVPVEQYLQPDPALARMLAAIPLRKAVFTNATSEHAWRVLRALGIPRCFEQVVGIRELGLCNKPRPEAYQRLLTLLDTRGPACILVDDRAVNLQPAKMMGMTTVLLHRSAREGPIVSPGTLLEGGSGQGGDPAIHRPSESAPEDGVDFVVAQVLEVGPLVTRLLEGQDDGQAGVPGGSGCASRR